GNPPPIALSELAQRVRLRKVTWREGTKGKLSARFAWLRVWPGQGWQEGACAGAGPVWLLIEEQADGKLKFAFSNLPPGTSCQKAVRLGKSRWPVEIDQAGCRSSGSLYLGGVAASNRRSGVGAAGAVVPGAPGRTTRR